MSPTQMRDLPPGAKVRWTPPAFRIDGVVMSQQPLNGGGYVEVMWDDRVRGFIHYNDGRLDLLSME